MTLDPKPDTRGSRKALGAENARLKSKVGRLCIENNRLRAAVGQCVRAIDQLLPGMRHIPCDVGLINQALITARPLIEEST